jgi:hypothetical protein
VTCGQYFEAVVQFLARNAWAGLHRAGRAENPDRGADRPLPQIDIFLEKHGAFYHPCRVVAVNGSHCIELVVNVAVSPEGCRLLAEEVELIENLRHRFDPEYLPAVFDCDGATLPDGRRLPMFLGQWFSNFFEFHLTATAAEGRAVVAWTPGGPRPLEKARRSDLYRQAAALLTGYYDVFSGQQILDWHHAAGDFVVRLSDDGPLALRLVTVRRYGALMSTPVVDLDTVLIAMTVFLVHTSLWLRLDRCDGVGDLILAGSDILDWAVEGFFDALARKVDRGEMPAEMLTAVVAHLSTYRCRDFASLITALAARRPRQDPTRALFEMDAAVHAEKLHHALDIRIRAYRQRSD